LNTSKVKQVKVPVPSLALQAEIADRLTAQAVAYARLRSALLTAQIQGAALRRAVLAAAFSGQLVQQDPADEPASALLDRIRAERATDVLGSRRRQVKAGA
jgi:type I restriction enzyme S subunit